MTISLSFILVLGIFLHGSYGLSVSCGSGTLIVTVNAADGLFNHTVSVVNKVECGSTQLTGSGDTQTAEFDCLSALGTDPFQLVFVNNAGMMMGSAPRVINSGCTGPSIPGFNFTLIIGDQNDSAPVQSVSGVIETDISMTILNQVTSVGTPNLIFINPGPDDLDTYRMFLDRVRLTSSSGHYDIVLDGCVNPPDDSNYVLFGPPSLTGSFFLVFNTIIPIGNSGPIRSTEILHVEATVKLCLIADAADCFELLGCGNANKVGRRKREASREINQVKLNGVMQVYMTEEEAESEKQKIINEESGRLTAPPVDDNQFCANRTLSYVIVAILVLGLVLSFIATIWLTLKVKQVQKNTDKMSSGRSLGTTTLKSSSRK